MKHFASTLGLMAVLMFVVLTSAALAQDATAGQVPAVPASSSTGQWTLYAVLALAVMQVSQWLKQILDAQKERRAAEEAEAEEAQAKAEEAKAQAAQVVSLDPAQVQKLQAHEVILGKHEVRITSLENYSRENREDHKEMFNKLDDIKGLFIAQKTGGAQ